MSKKENKNGKQNKDDGFGFDEFEEMFFSVGEDSSKLADQHDLRAEEDSDSDEDFGYAGDLDDSPMALDTNEVGSDVVDFEQPIPNRFNEMEISIQGELGEEFDFEDDSDGEQATSVQDKTINLEHVDIGETLDVFVEELDDFEQGFFGNSEEDISSEEEELLEREEGFWIEEEDDEKDELPPQIQVELEESDNDEEEEPSVPDFVEEELTPVLGLAGFENIISNEDLDDLNLFSQKVEEADRVQYQALSDEEYYKKRINLLTGEGKLYGSSGVLWAEAARYAWKYLRQPEMAVEYYEKARQNGALRNDELRSYADVVAATKQKVGKFVDLLQEWALGRDGSLAAEAWNEIAIFLRKNLAQVDLAAQAAHRAIESNPENWLSHQLLCQLQESKGDWKALLQSLQTMKELSSGALASNLAWQQGMISLTKLRDVEQAVVYLKEALSLEAKNFQIVVLLRQLAKRMNDSELEAEIMEHVSLHLDGNDKLFWMVKQALKEDASVTALSEELQKHQLPSAFWLQLALLPKEEESEEQRSTGC